MTSLLEALDETMGAGPGFPWYVAWFFACVVVVSVIHEAGHLVAAVATGQADVEATVGSHGQLVERRLGEVRIRMNALSAPWLPGGSVAFDGARTTARATVLISLAGPAATLAGATATGLLAASAGSGAVAEFLAATTLLGIFVGLGNLVPLTVRTGTRRNPGPALATDGRHAVEALGVLRELRSA
ncbi:MAG TPA: site-2 protease family protein [Gaiellaceae bacterium]|nr:site-2 protease family protein [Gaiellaceae bacterium]